jgi:hypothetical protein
MLQITGLMQLSSFTLLIAHTACIKDETAHKKLKLTCFHEPLNLFHTFGPVGLRTSGPSDQWAVGPMGRRTNGPSDQWAFGLTG